MITECLNAEQQLRLDCLRLAVSLRYSDEDPRRTAKILVRYVESGLLSDPNRQNRQDRQPMQTGTETAGPDPRGTTIPMGDA